MLHWIAWNIPAAAGGIPEGKLPDGTVQGANITGQNVYFGPGAPAGPRYHHYVFELYALNANLDLPATSGRDDLLKAMAGQDHREVGVRGTLSQRSSRPRSSDNCRMQALRSARLESAA